MSEHDWIPSELGHGETMCRRCFGTSRELAALGMLNHCDTPPKQEQKEPEMNITSIRVGRLKTTGSYNNYRVEVEAALQAGQDPAELRERLTSWVDDQIAREEGQRRLIVERDNLSWQCGSLEKQRNELRSQVAKGTEIIKRHELLRTLAQENGIDVPGLGLSLLSDEIPF